MNEQEGKPRAAAFISIGHLCQERKRKVSNIKILKSIFIYSFNSVSIDTIKEAYLRESLSQTGERHFSKDAEPLSLPWSQQVLVLEYQALLLSSPGQMLPATGGSHLSNLLPLSGLCGHLAHLRAVTQAIVGKRKLWQTHSSPDPRFGGAACPLRQDQIWKESGQRWLHRDLKTWIKSQDCTKWMKRTSSQDLFSSLHTYKTYAYACMHERTHTIKMWKTHQLHGC